MASAPALAKREARALRVDRYIVEFKAPPAASVARSRSVHGVRSYLSTLNAQHARIRAEVALPSVRVLYTYKNAFNGIAVQAGDSAIAGLARHPEVARIYPDTRVQATLSESIAQIGADQAWRQDASGSDCATSGAACIRGTGVRIAVLDTGVDYTHPHLGGCLGPGCKVIGGYDLINDDADPMDLHGHGTHVAATAAGFDPQGSFTGVAPGASILAYRVLDAQGYGSTSSIIAGVDRAVDPNQDGDFSDRADIISMSLGGPGNPDDPMSVAVDRAVDLGSIAIVAAGNSGPRDYTIGSPGTSRKAITVGAVDRADVIATFSSRGPVVHRGELIAKPDLVAPGVNICAAKANGTIMGTDCGAGLTSVSGTSMATPHVSGVAALIKQRNPSVTPADMKRILTSTALGIGNGEPYAYGSGRVRAVTALEGKVVYGPPSLDLGAVDRRGAVWNASATVTLFNQTNSPVTYAVQTALGQIPGLTVTVPASISVPAGGTQALTLSVLINNSLFAQDRVDSAVVLTPANAGLDPLTVPVVLIRPNAAVRVRDMLVNEVAQLEVDVDYPPSGIQLEIRTPLGTIDTLPALMTDLSTMWRASYVPAAGDGVYQVTAVVSYGLAQVRSSATLTRDATKARINTNRTWGGLVVTSNEPIGVGAFSQFFNAYEKAPAFRDVKSVSASAGTVTFSAIEDPSAGEAIGREMVSLYQFTKATGSVQLLGSSPVPGTIDSMSSVALRGQVFVAAVFDETVSGQRQDRVSLQTLDISSQALVEIRSVHTRSRTTRPNVVGLKLHALSDGNLAMLWGDRDSNSLHYTKLGRDGRTLITARQLSSSCYLPQSGAETNHVFARMSGDAGYIFCAGGGFGIGTTTYAQLNLRTGKLSSWSTMDASVTRAVRASNDSLYLMQSSRFDSRSTFSRLDLKSKKLTTLDDFEDVMDSMSEAPALAVDRAGNAYYALPANSWTTELVVGRYDARSKSVQRYSLPKSENVSYLNSDLFIDADQNMGLFSEPIHCSSTGSSCWTSTGWSYQQLSFPSAVVNGRARTLVINSAGKFTVPLSVFEPVFSFEVRVPDAAGNMSIKRRSGILPYI